MNHWALGLSYDGAPFHGWQRQRDQRTVQGELESALAQIANETVSVSAAGRTDAGVHATGQVVGFVTRSERDIETWIRGLNGLTSDHLRVDWVQVVESRFHARYSATARRYQYIFHDNGRFSDPLLHGRVWHCVSLDADAMHRASQTLLGEHDFSSFRASGCQSTTPNRRIKHCTVMRKGAFVVLEIEANAFLLHMVRNIASALHDIGSGRAPWSIAELLSAKDRTVLGITAPPDGLYLTRVSYADYCLPQGLSPALLNA